MSRLLQVGRWRLRVLVAVLGMVLMVGAREATAGQMTVTAYFSEDTMNLRSESVALPQFDPSLGTLTGVEVSVSSQATTDWVVSGSGLSTFRLAGNFGTSGPDFHDSQSPFETYFVPFSAYRIPAVPETTIFSNSDSARLTDFDTYIGTGSVLFDTSYEPLNDTETGPSFTFAGWNQWSGQISLIYSYSPMAAVPEPSSLVLGGLAILIGAGWRYRAIRRRPEDRTATN